MNSVNPVFSLIIISWNRKEVLKKILLGLSEQVEDSFQVIVVDNGSCDGTDIMLGDSFPQVKLIKLKKDIGVAAYNLGIEKASGEFLVLMDSDALLEKNALRKIKERFMQDGSIDVVSLNIINYSTAQSETQAWQHDTPNINGCAVAMRQKVLKEAIGYDRRYFLYHNDLELATRLLAKGYHLYHDHDIICYHLRAQASRVRGLALFYLTRNAFFYYWKYYPIRYASVLSLRESVYGFIRAFRERCLLWYFYGLISGILFTPRICFKRTPLKKELYLRLRQYLDDQFRQPLLKKAFLKFREWTKR
jgi:GT2 family glycosyltransferase